MGVAGLGLWNRRTIRTSPQLVQQVLVGFRGLRPHAAPKHAGVIIQGAICSAGVACSSRRGGVALLPSARPWCKIMTSSCRPALPPGGLHAPMLCCGLSVLDASTPSSSSAFPRLPASGSPNCGCSGSPESQKAKPRAVSTCRATAAQADPTATVTDRRAGRKTDSIWHGAARHQPPAASAARHCHTGAGACARRAGTVCVPHAPAGEAAPAGTHA